MIDASAGLDRKKMAALLDQAHRALRGIDAADQSAPIPALDLDRISDAVTAVEQFARDHGIVLSEFKHSPISAALDTQGNTP